ncbi:hypothetical protein KCP71_03590 [Salmonella enterica subsp. enterica]|nr:hypothetical protein KCP71_03590 [Salmonella enterica subsp. enterica]
MQRDLDENWRRRVLAQTNKKQCSGCVGAFTASTRRIMPTRIVKPASVICPDRPPALACLSGSIQSELSVARKRSTVLSFVAFIRDGT